MFDFLELLRRLNKDCRTLIKMLADYEKDQSRTDISPYERERKLEKISRIADRLPDFEGRKKICDWINQEHKSLTAAKDEFRFDFGRRLKELLSSRGWEIRGQYPRLRIGLYTVIVNFEFGRAEIWLGPEILKIKPNLPLTPDAIVENIQRLDADYRTSPFNAEAFGQDLRTAYERALLVGSRNFGDKLPLMTVLQEYVFLQQEPKFYVDPRREHFREFNRFMLAMILYRFMKTEFSATVRFQVATFDATSNPQKALWVPSDDEGNGTYFGQISFEV